MSHSDTRIFLRTSTVDIAFSKSKILFALIVTTRSTSRQVSENVIGSTSPSRISSPLLRPMNHTQSSSRSSPPQS